MNSDIFMSEFWNPAKSVLKTPPTREGVILVTITLQTRNVSMDKCVY